MKPHSQARPLLGQIEKRLVNSLSTSEIIKKNVYLFKPLFQQQVNYCKKKKKKIRQKKGRNQSSGGKVSFLIWDDVGAERIDIFPT